MRVLVTGGAGFVGSNLVDALCDEGHKVTVLDDLSTGTLHNLEQRLSEIELVEGTILDEQLVDRLVLANDLVFHLAAVVGVPHIIREPLHSMLVNANGTEHVLASCHKYGRKVVLVSSSEVNGKAASLPMHEEHDRVLGPTSSARWSYATAKALDEHLAFAYAEKGLRVTVLRYFNAYGPRMDARGYGSVVATFFNQGVSEEPLTIHGTGEQTRCFTYVGDTVRATVLAGFNDAADGQVFNIGDCVETSVGELADIVLQTTGSSAGVVHVDPRIAFGAKFDDTLRRVPDNSRAREVLGWEPSTTLEEGLRGTLEWWRLNRGEDFESRVVERSLVVGVVGLGYVGLPLATAFADAGFKVIGFDVDDERVADLNAGRSHIEDVPPEQVARFVSDGRFSATSRPRDLIACSAVFICVPTPFDAAKTPDLSYVRAAADTAAQALHPGMLVVLQSTTFPGTTTEVVQPVLEASGLLAGRDFSLAFSPERVDPGNKTWTVRNTPKVVGGVTSRSAERTKLLLEAVMDRPGLVQVLSSPEAAEMTKLLENTYRAVNIALVNELAVLSHEMGIDVWEVIDGARTKPFGFQAFYPGAGPGGHCIPVDPYYLAWKAREHDFTTRFVELAADTNLRMAYYVRDRVTAFASELGTPVRGARVLAVGASFKPGVSDTRNSRALRVIELLDERGAFVDYLDPGVPVVELSSGPRKGVDPASISYESYDLVVVLVPHPEWDPTALESAQVAVFDAAGAMRGCKRERIERL